MHFAATSQLLRRQWQFTSYNFSKPNWLEYFGTASTVLTTQILHTHDKLPHLQMSTQNLAKLGNE